jgi:hypothetical protein
MRSAQGATIVRTQKPKMPCLIIYEFTNILSDQPTPTSRIRKIYTSMQTEIRSIRSKELTCVAALGSSGSILLLLGEIEVFALDVAGAAQALSGPVAVVWVELAPLKCV